MTDHTPHASAFSVKAKDHKPKKTGKQGEIPLVPAPSENELLAEQMAEIFDEDRVTHQHGSSEPEAD